MTSDHFPPKAGGALCHDSDLAESIKEIVECYAAQMIDASSRVVQLTFGDDRWFAMVTTNSNRVHQLAAQGGPNGTWAIWQVRIFNS